MTDYTELVKALRYCASGDGMYCRKCIYQEVSNMSCDNALIADAAAAIEALQAEVIDKDYLIQKQADEIDRLRLDVEKQQKQMIELAKKLPKRGEWKITTEKFTPELICSKCGVHIPCVAGWCMDAHMNYCPNCGAKMEVQE